MPRMQNAILTLSAVYLAVVGFALMLFPLEFGVGAVPPDASPELVALLRLLGGPFLGIAALNWLSRGIQAPVAVRPVIVANVIGFGLLFWELDRGGPVARHTQSRNRLAPADWRFSQDENRDTATEVAATSAALSDWRPQFVDYLYVSLTNSSAFSPTDTMPLSPRAKVLMGLEATVALLTSLLVVARAVGALGGG